MGIYRVPLVWQMYGHMDVEAKSLYEAIEYALGPECPLPEGSYLAPFFEKNKRPSQHCEIALA